MKNIFTSSFIIAAFSFFLFSCAGNSENLSEEVIYSKIDSAEASTIKRYTFDNREFKNLPQNMGKLRNLEHLTLDGFKLGGHLKGLKDLNKLETMYIENDSSETFPEEICFNSQLLTLNMKNVYYDNIPSSIMKQKKLQRLSCYHSKIKSIPESLCHLSQLEEIQIIDNELTEVNACLFDSPNLKTIILLKNNIKSFSVPNSLSNSSLVNFNIAYNPIEKLPDNLFSGNLQCLGADSCRLKELPASIGYCTSLKILTVGKNDLSTLPESFRNLKLTELTISDNRFKYLPSVIYEMETLTDLFVHNNDFKIDPSRIASKHLNRLGVSPDQILYLNKNSFSKFKNLILLIKLSDSDNIDLYKKQFETDEVSVMKLNEINY